MRIDEIRASDSDPGLRDFEANLLRLLEKVTNGCIVEINETGDWPTINQLRKQGQVLIGFSFQTG
jgi:hypothetical protein